MREATKTRSAGATGVQSALVNPEWLAKHRSDPKVKLIEIAGMNQNEMQAYRAGHVPGAVCWTHDRSSSARLASQVRTRQAQREDAQLDSRKRRCALLLAVSYGEQ